MRRYEENQIEAASQQKGEDRRDAALAFLERNGASTTEQIARALGVEGGIVIADVLEPLARRPEPKIERSESGCSWRLVTGS